MTITSPTFDSQSALPPDVRDALMGAAALAASWDVDLRPAKRGAFPERVAAVREAVLALEKNLAAVAKNADPADPRVAALLELRTSPRLLRAAATYVEPKPRNRLELPRIIGGSREEPRVAGLASAYLPAVHGQADGVTFAVFLRAFQTHEPLTLAEIWQLPAFLRFAVLEELLKEADNVLSGAARSGERLLVYMASLRAVGNTEWAILLEPLIVFDAILRRDPTGTFGNMDFESREQYRRRIAFIARHSDVTESQVAEQAFELAREASWRTYKDPRILARCSHIGYFLVNKGFALLAERVNFHPPISFRIRSSIRANADDFYITGIAVITIFFIAAALFPLLPNYPVFGKLAVTFVLMIMPAMQCVVELMNNSVTAIFDPEPLPKMDFSDRIPADCATLVVVPTLLLNERQVRELVNEMEVRFLANRDPNLHFALLSDLPDSVNKPHDNDSSPLVSLAVQLIKDLNARYSSPDHGGFLLLHRHRIFSVRQGVWMGWERKRGKLLDLNKLLVGEYDAFPIKAGRLEALHTVRYILTLDSDTQLPAGSAARMIGALAHPLNQAIIDPKLRIVVEGYGILQPRVGVSVSSASRSRLANLYSGQSGLDIYTMAISDAYQDLYGEGIFTGKGIYEVSVLHAVLNRRFPRNSLLSHDLIEGAYARAGLVTDIEVIDDYPSHYSAYTRRKHRWVRGDWQIARWVFSRVPDESNRMVPNPISLVSRWKVFDNLRRSLVEPFTFILFVAGWLWLPGGPVYWTIVPLALFLIPTLLQFAFALGRALASDREGAVAQALEGSGHAALMALLNLSFLPHQTMLVLDAVTRSLIRRFITGERLLEWETAAEAETQARRITPVDRYLALMPLIAGSLAIILFFVSPHHFALLVASPILLLWCMATVLTAWLNRPPHVTRQLSALDRDLLLCHALRIWRYFHEFGTDRHSFLIPDNVEEQGKEEAARVSPTNIGLLLNARQAAVEFGFITLPEFASLTESSLATIARLEKFRGHLYNWYDTRTGAPLEANPFVSSVDSGNFVASLFALHAGTKTQLNRPLLSHSLFSGLRTHWETMQQEGKLPAPLARLAPPPASAPLAGWLAWLHSAATAFDSGPAPSYGDPWWYAETRHRIHAVLQLVRDYIPWSDPCFEPLRQVSGFGINAAADQLAVDAAIGFAEQLERKLAHAQRVSNGGQSLAEQLALAMQPAIPRLRALSQSLKAIAQQSEKLIAESDFAFLVSPVRRLLSIGYDVREQKLHSACYDMLASEARLATFLAIAHGDLAHRSWFRLAREYTYAFDTPILTSWTGTMFEYLMPSLWMRTFPNTLLSGTLAASVRVQQEFARKVGIHWGISESGHAKRDDGGHYQYRAFGIPQIAASWDATAGPVVSPYSTFLALEVDTVETIRNLRRMSSAGWVGPYGFYEAVDYSTGMPNGEIVREWMAHHQGMSLMAVLNCLHDGAMQQWFHSNTLIQSAELLLHEIPRSKALLRAMRKDFTFVIPRAEAA
ncbi:MAG TPA: glucoamylase family protein [Terracidiphilus sp.]|nr:glucoamylase family protein [Terracidiphilus sp.]